MMQLHHSFRHQLRRAFTLLELLVVIGIIVMLLGLTVAVVSIVSQNSETRQVEQALKVLETALQEWETAAERQITYGINNQPAGATYEIQEVSDLTLASEPHRLIRQTLAILNKSSTPKQMIASINPQLLQESTTALQPPNDALLLTVVDPWEHEILVVFPGRRWVSGFDALSNKDDDGTIKTAIELLIGSCTNRRTCFVSAGPDGDFQVFEDNIYSYPLERP